jgi:hypothetical protein
VGGRRCTFPPARTIFALDLAPGREGLLDLAGEGEASGLMLGEDELAVCLDVKDSAGACDQLGPDAQLLLQLVRQTGGSRQVASRPAVFDGDAFGHALASLGLSYA